MVYINDNFNKLAESYLFAEIADKRTQYQKAHPQAKLISLGIGDVTQPLCPAVVQAMQQAVQEMGAAGTFRGYGPYEGYDFLINAILQNDYAPRGVQLNASEIFVSDGSKSDSGNIGDIFSAANVVAVSDPVYPVYIDTNIMAGRQVRTLPCTETTGFCPEPPDWHADLICLCSPNNPTGAVFSKEQLTAWVNYAREHQAIILYDAAYKAFITDPSLPQSIYEIPGAQECAIEFCSFSKTAGFTGTRCAWAVVPQALRGQNPDGTAAETSLNALWFRRQSTKFNGVPYIVQRGAAAIYTPEGQAQVKQVINHYLQNAKIIRDTLLGLGFSCTGGENSPYIWLKTPAGQTSWQFFDLLLNELNIIGTPGSGFGQQGEGYFRLTAFGSLQDTQEAAERLKRYFQK